jgi:hypothetical protein
MTRPYSPNPAYPASRKPAYRRNVADADSGSTETVVIEDYDAYDRYGADKADADAYGVQYADELDEQYDEDDYYESIDRRWIWVGGVAAAVLLVAVICTVVILGGGDSGSVSATVSPPAVTTSQVAPSTSHAPPPPPAPLPTAGPLSPETVTSVSPVPTAAAAPTETVAAPDPRTITYQITGSRQLLDLVTVIYTDQQGALQTDVNVALPWSKTVVLDPGVQLTSVTATSLLGKLNCSITDASGAMISAQTNNSLIATCTK